MSMSQNTAITRLTKVSSGYCIDGIELEKLACSINDNVGVVVPIQAFLLENALRVGDAWRTVEKHGYALNVWYDFLTIRNIGVFDAVESHLRDFLLGGGTRRGNVTSLKNSTKVARTKTNLDKFHTIASFYDFWQNKRGQKLRSYRGTTLADITENIFERSHRSLATAKINFSRSQTSAPQKRPTTPSPEESEEVLLKALDQKDPNRAQTYYLIGQLARYSGSRAVGIAGLYVRKLFSSLKKEPSFRRIENYSSVLDNHLRPENRSLIARTLRHMRHEERKFIYCDVVNKGGDWTTIAIPIALCEELLDYICTMRQDLVESRFRKNGRVPPDNVFLSYKNGPLTQEAIVNFHNKNFKDLEIDGSFHRLRAAFCQEVVRDIYLRERAVNGRAWQVNNVLEFARKLLGHKNPRSLEPYLNNVLAQEVLFGEPVMVDSKHDANYVRAIAAQLNAPESSQFREELGQFLAGSGVDPILEEGRRYALF